MRPPSQFNKSTSEFIKERHDEFTDNSTPIPATYTIVPGNANLDLTRFAVGAYLFNNKDSFLSHDDIGEWDDEGKKSLKKQIVDGLKVNPEGPVTVTLPDKGEKGGAWTSVLQFITITVNKKDYKILFPEGWGMEDLSAGKLGSVLQKAVLNAEKEGLSPEHHHVLLAVKIILSRFGRRSFNHLAGDGEENGIHLLNKNLPEIIRKLNAQIEGAGDILFQVLLEHEFWHEATGRKGRAAETERNLMDIARYIELAGERGIDAREFAALLQEEQLITRAFKIRLEATHDFPFIRDENLQEIEAIDLPDRMHYLRISILEELALGPLPKPFLNNFFGKTDSGYYVIRYENPTNKRTLDIYLPQDVDNLNQAFIIDQGEQVFLSDNLLANPAAIGCLTALSEQKPQLKSLREFLTLWTRPADSTLRGSIRLRSTAPGSYISIVGHLDRFVRPRATNRSGLLIHDAISGRLVDLHYESDRGFYFNGSSLPLKKDGIALAELDLLTYVEWLITQDVDWNGPRAKEFIRQRFSSVRHILYAQLPMMKDAINPLVDQYENAMADPETTAVSLLRLVRLEEQLRHLGAMVETWQRKGLNVTFEEGRITAKGDLVFGKQHFSLPLAEVSEFTLYRLRPSNRRALDGAGVLVRRANEAENLLPNVLTLGEDTMGQKFINGRVIQVAKLSGSEEDDVQDFIRTTFASAYNQTGAIKIGTLEFQIVPKRHADIFRDAIKLRVSGLKKGNGLDSDSKRSLAVSTREGQRLAEIILEPERHGVQTVYINGKTFQFDTRYDVNLYEYVSALADVLVTEEHPKLLDTGAVSANNQRFTIAPRTKAIIDRVKDKLSFTLSYKADRPDFLEIYETVDNGENKQLARIKFHGLRSFLVKGHELVPLRPDAQDANQIMVYMKSPELLEWMIQFSDAGDDKAIAHKEGVFRIQNSKFIRVFPRLTEGKRSSDFFGEVVDPETQEAFRAFLNQRVRSKSRHFGRQEFVERTFSYGEDMILRFTLIGENRYRVDVGKRVTGDKEISFELDTSKKSGYISMEDLSTEYWEYLKQVLWKEFQNTLSMAYHTRISEEEAPALVI